MHQENNEVVSLAKITGRSYGAKYHCLLLCYKQVAPPGLDNVQQLSHRLRSGLLLCCPYRGMTKTPHRGVTTVAHCVSGG